MLIVIKFVLKLCSKDKNIFRKKITNLNICFFLNSIHVGPVQLQAKQSIYKILWILPWTHRRWSLKSANLWCV